jgi:hypothetical protein
MDYEYTGANLGNKTLYYIPQVKHIDVKQRGIAKVVRVTVKKDVK